MRIFLTGATGYIGGALLDALVRGGHDITALVRDNEKARRVAKRSAERASSPHGRRDRGESPSWHWAQRAAPGVFRVDHIGAAAERGPRLRGSRNAHEKVHFRPLPCGCPETAGRLGGRRRDVKTTDR